MSEDEHTAIHVRVYGTVQGVGFRYVTRDRAARLGVTGWVRNDRDGSVEVYAEGPRDKIEQFESYLRKGPPSARVRSVDVRRRRAQNAYPRFTIEY